MAGNKSKTAVWIILGLSVLGFGGFGVSNFSGGSSKLATVGSQVITALEYQRALNQQLRALQAQTGQAVSFPTAQSIGLDQQTLAQLVTERVLDNETVTLGLSVGDTEVANQIKATPAFAGLDGNLDRTVYTDLLRAQNWTEASYEAAIRNQTARNILQTAVINGVPAATTMTDALVQFVAERRDVVWAEVTADNLAAPVAEPTETDLATYYSAHPEAFTTTETKEITFVWLTPDMLKDRAEVDEAAVRDLYDQRIDEFVQPERRLVERLVFQDQAAADAALTRITSGDVDFDGLVAERGLDLADVDMGDVALADLGPAGDAVFAATAGDVVGPFDSTLGPALFRMNAILGAEEVTFDEAKGDLRDELAVARSRRMIDEMTTTLNDLMAGGATLEDLDDRTNLEKGSIEWTADATDGIAAYDGFRTAAAAANVGDFPELVVLEDGGVFALRVDALREPALQELDEVRAQVLDLATQEATNAAVLAEAERLAALITGAEGFAATGLVPTVETAITRANFIPGTPAEFLQTAFDLNSGGVKVIPSDNGAIIVQISKISAPDLTDPDTQARRTSIDDQLRQGIAQDIMAIYSTQLRAKTTVSIDQAMVNAVHANFQ